MFRAYVSIAVTERVWARGLTVVNVQWVGLQYVSVVSASSVTQGCGDSVWKTQTTLESCETMTCSSVVRSHGAASAVSGLKRPKLLYSRVALDRVGVAGGAGGALCHVTLEEGVAVGVGLFCGADVGVEWICGGANGQLLRSHWFGCGDDKRPL